jgi:hypothetical protein
LDHKTYVDGSMIVCPALAPILSAEGVQLWINGLLAISTLILAVFAVVQAFATKASVKVLTNSERAWVMVHVRAQSLGWIVLEKSQGIEKTSAAVYCELMNYGRTPAHIIGIQAKLLILESDKALPKTPDLALTEIEDSEPRSLGSGQIFNVPLNPSCEGNSHWKNMILFGVVKYRHIFSDDEVQTTFGYVITAGNERLKRLSDYPEYNKNT